MPLPTDELQDRFRAAFLGLAIGDALGFPLKEIPVDVVGNIPGLGEDFANRPRGRYSKGQFSDDTQLMLATAESIIADGRLEGRSVAAHFGWLWREGVILLPPRELTAAVERHLQGTPWMSAGAPLGQKDPSALSRALVVGLWDDDLGRQAHNASTVSILTHKDPTCAAAAAAYARAVSLGVQRRPLPAEAFCEAVGAAAAVHDGQLGDELLHLPRVLHWEVPVALEQLRKVGVPPSLLRESTGLPAHVTPVLLMALYAALKVPQDFRSAVKLVLATGGEADVAAALTGGLLGASLGTEGIPVRLRRNVLYSGHVIDTADRFFETRLAAQARVMTVAPAARRR